MGNAAYAEICYGAFLEGRVSREERDEAEELYDVQFLAPGFRHCTGAAPIVAAYDSIVCTSAWGLNEFDLLALSKLDTSAWDKRIAGAFEALGQEKPTKCGWHLIASYR